LEKGVLRHVGPAFAEDSLRVLRGVQFASRFRLHGAPETVALCQTLSLSDLSRERIGEEFRKWLLQGTAPSFGLRFFTQVNLQVMFPEIRPLNGSWEFLEKLLDALVPYRDALLPAAALRLMFAGLLCGTSEEKASAFLTQWMPEHDLPRKAPPLLRFALGSYTDLRRAAVSIDGLEIGAALAAALKEATSSPAEGQALYADLKQRAEAFDVWTQAPEPFLTGKILLDLGLSPGRQMGEIIRKSFELQLDGVLTNADMAREWAARELPAQIAAR
jgi:tRNA nucleotidyltransferase (CCA-adding enzyme)